MVRIPFGKKHTEIVKAWIPSAMTFGTGAFLGLLYFTDWKTVLQFLPFYNTKFTKKEEEEE